MIDQAKASTNMANARDALAKNDALSAFTHLRWVLEFPSPMAADAALWREVVPLFASICGHIAGEALAANILAVADPEKPGVVIAYDMQTCELNDTQRTELAEQAPGQILYEHASCWTQPDLIAPDVCHYLHQVNEAPWGERLQFDPSSRQSMHAPQDTRPPNIVAREIVDAPALTPDDVVEGEDAAIAALVAAARALPEYARPVMLRSDGLRLRQRDDSPVKSNRFG